LSIKLVGNPAPAAWGKSGLVPFFAMGIQAVGPEKTPAAFSRSNLQLADFWKTFFHSPIVLSLVHFET
jgi:hypothetical protein